GTTSEAEVALPYLPFVEAIGNYLAGADLDRIKLQLGPATCRQLGQLLPQFELQTTLIDPGEPAQAKMRLYEAILAFLRLAAERTGLLLVLEDLHWADPSTRELLEYIARRVRRRSRILLLATYRNDELNRRHPLRPLIQGWQRSGIAQIVDLQPLPPVGVSQQPAAAVLNALRSFVQDQLMDEEVSGRYRFRHALTREAIHDDLIAPERERLHACAADWLRSQLFPDKHDLAYHLMAAGHWDEAVPIAIEAAQAAQADT